MLFNVTFEATDQRFTPSFGEIHNVSDGGYDQGYNAGYDKGYQDGKVDNKADAIIDRTITEIESNVSKVEDYTFYTCKSLTRAILPNATYCGDNSFRDCSNLVTVSIPNATDLQGGSFRDCVKLEYIDLPKVKRMYASVFQGCEKLKIVILRANVVCNISNVSVLADTAVSNGTGLIYVPDDLVDEYRENSVWKTYANQIKPISEL